jgi:TolA-binding protein
MRSGFLLGSLALLTVSCGIDRHVGQRYEAEQDLWRANWEYQNLSIRPQEVSEAQWETLAQDYAAIADRYTSRAAVAGSKAQQQLQIIAARALFAAAQVHTILGDSTRVEEIYLRMAKDFRQLPEVAAEVTLARGGIAEDRGSLTDAADLYQTVVDRIDPSPAGTGAANIVLDLPLRIARLRSKEAPASARSSHYADAKAYYQRLARNHADDLVRLDAQTRMAEIAADLWQWDEAKEALRLVETQLLSFQKPPREPASARFAIAGIQKRAGAAPESTRLTLVSILHDYPDCDLAPQVLLALAQNADERDQVDEALEYLDRIVEEHKEDEQAAPHALLIRGQFLESHDRWPEALETLRDLSVHHPISEAALQVPIEIAAHYSRVQDHDAAEEALDRAVQEYRDFIARYPPGPRSIFARECLAEALALRQDYDSAIKEMLSLGEELVRTPKGATHFLAAASIACNDLADTARAISILNRVGALYTKAALGSWAADEAERLRRKMSQ